MKLFLGKVNKGGDKFQTRKNDYSDFFKAKFNTFEQRGVNENSEP